MKSCSIPGAAASCNEYYKQKHDEHTCTSKKMGWSGWSGWGGDVFNPFGRAYHWDIDTLPSGLQDELRKDPELMNCPGDAGGFGFEEGCDLKKIGMLTKNYAPMECFLNTVRIYSC